MRKIRLGRQEYKDKVLGFWLGKNIVGTPFEGQKYVYNLCRMTILIFDSFGLECLSREDQK